METSLSDGLYWKNDENRVRFVGIKPEILQYQYGFDFPKDIDKLSENKAMQERLRTMADVLTEKEYEKRGKILKPANYEEITDYLGKKIKSWNMDNDLSVILLKEAIQKKDYPVLADQIDTCLGTAVFQNEQIKIGDKDMQKAVEHNYHTPNAKAYLVSQIENLRRYRKFLYGKLSERG